LSFREEPVGGEPEPLKEAFQVQAYFAAGAVRGHELGVKLLEMVEFQRLHFRYG